MTFEAGTEPSAPSTFPTLAVVLVAGLVGALLALFAKRLRRDAEHAGRM